MGRYSKFWPLILILMILINGIHFQVTEFCFPKGNKNSIDSICCRSLFSAMTAVFTTKSQYPLERISGEIPMYFFFFVHHSWNVNVLCFALEFSSILFREKLFAFLIFLKILYVVLISHVVYSLMDYAFVYSFLSFVFILIYLLLSFPMSCIMKKTVVFFFLTFQLFWYFKMCAISYLYYFRIFYLFFHHL